MQADCDIFKSQFGFSYLSFLFIKKIVDNDPLSRL